MRVQEEKYTYVSAVLPSLPSEAVWGGGYLGVDIAADLVGGVSDTIQASIARDPPHKIQHSCQPRHAISGGHTCKQERHWLPHQQTLRSAGISAGIAILITKFAAKVHQIPKTSSFRALREAQSWLLGEDRKLGRWGC